MISIELKLERFCKHSVVFKPVGEEDAKVLSSIYIKNNAFAELGSPKRIGLTIGDTND